MNKIRWQCRRGMLELDVLLQNFVEQHYQRLSAIDQKNFEKLLTHTDQDLYRWLFGRGEPANNELKEIISRIRLSA